MTTRIEKSVFISYRRTNFPWALNIYQDLTHHGYDVFFDYESIDSGDFEKIILDNIRARAHFIVVLTPSALERCKEPDDWLRREIETAIDEKRNIVPLTMDGFDFGSPLVAEVLTGKLSMLSNKNGLPIYAAYFFEGMEKLRDRYLNIAIRDVPLKFLSNEAQKITEAQQTAANAAPPVAKEQLSAQEWLEQGKKNYYIRNLSEAIRCYTKAIQLIPNFIDAYYNRAIAREDEGDLEGAIQDYEQIDRLMPNNKDNDHSSNMRKIQKLLDHSMEEDNEDSLFKHESARLDWLRGTTRVEKGDFDGAITDYSEVIRLRPDFPGIYCLRGNAYRHKGDLDRAIVDYDKAIEIAADDFTAYYEQGLLYQLNGELDKAVADFTNTILIKPDHAVARTALLGILKKLGREDEAKEHEQIALIFIQKEDEYNRACFEAIRGKTDMALKLLEIWLAKTPSARKWAKQDPDFENIRNDPRFKELVGE